MESSSLSPVVFVTTVQPLLVGWVLVISFFLTLSFVAVISKGRRWYELGCIFVLVYLVMSVGSIATTATFLDLQIMDVEVISMVNTGPGE